MTFFLRPALVTVIVFTANLPSWAQSGRVTFVTGDVQIQRQDGTRSPATRGAPINPGDQVVSSEGGLAQLDMADRAKLSVRPNTQVQVIQYGDRPDSDTPSTVKVLRGTMRSFTGALTPRDRERFSLKTDLATVGVRGSGNVLFAGRAAECSPDRLVADLAACAVTVNHTLEGSHIVAFGDITTPAGFGSAPSLVSAPGQTVLVTSRGEIRYIPLPSVLAEAGINPTGVSKVAGLVSDGDTRDFGPNDERGWSASLGTVQGRPVGDNGLGFKLTPTVSDFLETDPDGLQDAIVAGGFSFAGQALPADIRLDGGALRSYRLYPGLGASLVVSIDGGASRDVQTYSAGGLAFTVGRWEGGVLNFGGAGPGSSLPGSLHWILAGSGYPPYLADVLTGTVTYLPVIQTSPTNQANTAGTLTTARLDVNFSARTVNAVLGIVLPSAAGNPGGTWQLAANAVPILGGSFYASTGGRLLITNVAGIRSDANGNLAGSIEGRFVGPAMQGAALGYTISDTTAASSVSHNTVSGVVGFRGPAQDPRTPYVDGIVSDPANRLAGSLLQSLGFAARPSELGRDASGRVISFAAPFDATGERRGYALGSARIAESGFDAATGLVWGRWAGGAAIVGGASTSLQSASLHHIFSGVQQGPVTLPLTGSASYDWIGGTSPTDGQGNVGNVNRATLAVNFGQRTVDVGLSLGIGSQALSASALNVPIYRGQYFSAFQGASAVGGLPIPSLLNISCVPSCANPRGSIEGFFAGRSGAGAGLLYNLNGVTGTAAFRRPGG